MVRVIGLFRPGHSVMRGAWALVFTVLAACDGGSPSEGVAGPDAGRAETGADANPNDANPADASADDATPDADRGDAHSIDASGDAPDDGGACAHWPEFCAIFGCPDPSLCEAAIALEPDVTLKLQNTASGGHGECVGSASGVGGPSLYYSFSIPAGRYVNIIATPVGPPPVGNQQRALIRVLSACNATKATVSDIAAGSVPGEAALCLRNGSANRRVIVAVSRYSGEYGNLPLAFDLSVVLHDSVDDCAGAVFNL
jgi:hypothetical protein